jgi:carbonic anhydrase
MRTTNGKSLGSQYLCRRDFLGTSLGTCAITPFGRLSLDQLAASLGESLTKEQRDNMTPGQIIDELKNGNGRFRSGK